MEQEKKYKLSLVLGRLNHIHNGHRMLIEKSREVSKETLILLGSAQEKGTLRNPFSFETRKRLLEKIFKRAEDIIIYGLNDMSNEHDINHKWGRYILDNVYNLVGKKPDVMFYGNDESRNGWFSKEDIEGIDEQIISRDILKISATYLRGLILINDKEKWIKYVPEEIHEEFDLLRKELLEIEVYKKIYEKLDGNLTIENFEDVYKVYEKIDKENKLKDIK